MHCQQTHWGKTQPCDASVFGTLKSNINSAISTASFANQLDKLDLYQICALLRHSMYQTFTRANITSSFAKSGVWPLDRHKLMSIPRPHDIDDEFTLISVDEMERMFFEQRDIARRRIVGDVPVVNRRGFVDTTRGLVLTSDAALASARLKSQEYHSKQESIAKKHARRNRAEKEWIARAENARWIVRAHYAGISTSELRARVRPLRERRAVARAHALNNAAGASVSNGGRDVATAHILLELEAGM